MAKDTFTRGTMLLLLLLAVGACSSARVYQLSPDGEADEPRRLLVELKDALGPTSSTSLTSFTLCLWFKVNTFLSFNTLLSYSEGSNSILTISPQSEGVEIEYFGRLIRHNLSLSLLWWYPTCVAVRPGALLTWVLEEEEDLPLNATLALPLNGSLLLGQEEETFDVGFDGLVTGLSLWPAVLSSEEMGAWSKCQDLSGAPLLAWRDLFPDEGGPCGPLGPVGGSVVFLNEPMTWNGSRAFMEATGMRMVSPKSPEELQEVLGLLAPHGRRCLDGPSGEASVWLPLTLNPVSGELEGARDDGSNATASSCELVDRPGPKSRAWRRFVYLGSGGQCYAGASYRKLCSVGAYVRPPSVYRLNVKYVEGRDVVAYSSYEFVLAYERSPNGTLYFRGFDGHRIEYDPPSRSWLLRRRSRRSRAEMTDVAYTNHTGLPVGTLLWHVLDDRDLELDDKTANLTLSTCSVYQYTCMDGKCISVDSLCDLKLDCFDGSDEMACYNAFAPDGYIAEIQPRIPLPVLVNVRVNRIDSIDIMNSALRLDLLVLVSWFDPRVEFRHLHFSQQKVLSTKKLWSPTLLVDESFTKSESDEPPLLLVRRKGLGQLVNGEYHAFSGAENPLVLHHKIIVDVSCSFDLRSYPADEQKCNATIVLTNVRIDGLIINASSGVERCPEQLEEYEIKGCRLLFQTISDEMVVELTLQRRGTYHIWVTYLPSILILTIGYGTLFLPAEFFNERGFMSLTTLLVFISLYTDMNSTLPNTAYVKHIDVWFIFSIVYLSLIITTHLATSSAALHRSPPSGVISVEPLSYEMSDDRKRTHCLKAESILKWAKVVFGAVTIAFFCYYFTNA